MSPGPPAGERATPRIDPVAAVGFGRAAEVYERARPSYPAAAIEWLVDRAGLRPGRAVADVGAGTGKLTRLLTASGAHVVAVEPIAEMRALIEGAEAVDGTAESLPFADASIDVVTVAQAFHWFELDRALPELHRVLRPGGSLVLVWNMRDLENPVQRALEELLTPFRGTVVPQRHGAWREPLAQSPLFGEPSSREFAHDLRSTTEELVERVASTSFVAILDEPEREALLERVRELTAGIDEPFAFPYRTEVQIFPRR